MVNERVYSIDVFRAITMFLMIFVNDVAGVAGIPQWLGHTAAAEDGMGFSDVIFPAFLVIVGLSLPIALEQKQRKGYSQFKIGSYVLLRALALIIMGFFHVNLGGYSAVAPIAYPIYVLLLTGAFFLIWNDYAPKITPLLRHSLVAAGILLLLTLTFLYEGKTHGLRPSWWGILGIIGWAYLVAATTWLLLGGKLRPLLIAFLIFMGINICTHAGLVGGRLPIIGDASSITLIMSGVLATSVYRRMPRKIQTRFILSVAAVVFVVAGFVLRPFTGGISKIYATPAWVLICMGISLAVFAGLIWLIDQQKKAHWFALIKPAGTHTLTCYLIPYIVYACFKLFHFQYPTFFNSDGGGIFRSLVFALFVIGICRVMEKMGVKLRV